MRPSFAKLPQPFIVNVLRERDPDSAIATIKNAEYDGAQAHDLHLSILGEQYLNYKDLRRIVASTSKPILALNYRHTPGMSDEERLKPQLVALEAGAAGIDIPANIFDAPAASGAAQPNVRSGMPQELSTDEAVIAKQIELIDRVHAMGAEVLLSSHTRVVMSTEQVVAHAQQMALRGADIVKIVSVCTSKEELVEAFRSIVALKKTLDVPFQYQCQGEHGKLTRVVGPMLGNMLVFCNQRYIPASITEQPLVTAMRSVFQNVDWQVSIPLDEQNFSRS
ncbi:MAG: type 3-dehydroquinate dehydratase [Paenibacillus sp.]|jgi:hypothetical protein|nr:type 3-dehydroquinate dehydratase [Paenibacillus sp.]